MPLFVRLSLLFAIFLDLVGFGMAFPDLQLRAEKLGAPGWLIGVVLSSYFVTQLIFSPHWGRLSDRIGRKPVLLACTALSAGSMFIYAFADQIWIILASRILAGFAAANVVVAQAHLSETSVESERQKVMGQMSAAITIGLIAGPALGGYLVSLGGNYLMGMAAGTASVLSLLWILFGIPHQRPERELEPGKAPILAFGIVREVPGLIPVFVVAVAGWFVLACLEGTFGRLIKHNLGYGQLEFGLIFSYESLVGAGVGLALVWVARHLSHSATLRLGYVMTGLGLAAMPLARSFFELLAAGTFFAIGTGLTNPTINTVSSLVAPKEKQGELFGVLQATRSFGFLFGPPLGGFLFDLSPASPYLLAASVAILAALFLRIPAAADSTAAIQPA